MQDKNWVDTAEDIFRSVFTAVENHDYAGLSRDIEDKVNRVVGQVNNKLGDLGQKINDNINQRPTGATVNRTEEWVKNKKEREQAKAAENGKQLPKQYTQLYMKNPPGTYSGPACMALGITGISLFGMGTLGTAIGGLFFNPLWIVTLFLSMGLGGSIATLVHGVKKKDFIQRFESYVKQIGKNQYCDLNQLANRIGRSKSFVLKDVRKMINKGLFIEGHLDNEGNTLITSDKVYQHYLDAEQSRKTRELMDQRETELIQVRELKYEEYPEPVRKVLYEGEEYIKQIRDANDAIPGEAMSKKLDTLEDIMKRIFEQVKRDPSSVNDLQKLMKYYLPTTAKLIKAYQELDGQPSYGEQNIANTKKEIEDTMDVINDAFGKLFDDMFQDAAWDISTEISTMKTMLAKEGLTGGRDFVMDEKK